MNLQLRSADFLKELICYADYVKAESVYRKCLKAGKRNLAEKIRRKYNIQVQNDDTITAFVFAFNNLSRSRNLNKPK